MKKLLLVIWAFAFGYANAQFRVYSFCGIAPTITNYRTTDPQFDLQNILNFSPLLGIGIQGEEVIALQTSLMFRRNGGKQKHFVGNYGLVMPISLIYLWKINNQWNWWLEASAEIGYFWKEKSGIFSQNQFYSFQKHYLGFSLSPGIQYKISEKFTTQFLIYYSLQLNDASKNEQFVGKFQNYGVKLIINRYQNMRSKR